MSVERPDDGVKQPLGYPNYYFSWSDRTDVDLSLGLSAPGAWSRLTQRSLPLDKAAPNELGER